MPSLLLSCPPCPLWSSWSTEENTIFPIAPGRSDRNKRNRSSPECCAMTPPSRCSKRNVYFPLPLKSDNSAGRVCFQLLQVGTQDSQFQERSWSRLLQLVTVVAVVVHWGRVIASSFVIVQRVQPGAKRSDGKGLESVGMGDVMLSVTYDLRTTLLSLSLSL